MTDSEKIKLIDRIITDFWEFHSNEQIEKTAIATVTAIGAVVGFECNEK